jgi:hypothetical protein
MSGGVVGTTGTCKEKRQEEKRKQDKALIYITIKQRGMRLSGFEFISIEVVHFAKKFNGPGKRTLALDCFVSLLSSNHQADYGYWERS